MIKQTFRVQNMECPNCAMRLESLEDELQGVRQIKASYRKMELVVEYDETQLNEMQIIDATRKIGYHIIPSFQK